MTTLLNTHHIMPTRTMSHIQWMGFVMSLVIFLSVLGLYIILGITNSWGFQGNNTTFIEITNYDDTTQTAVDRDLMTEIKTQIIQHLSQSQIVTSMNEVNQPTAIDDLLGKDFDVVAPIFIEATLHKNRTEKSEQALFDKIQSISHHITLNPITDFEQDIKKTANQLRLIFIGFVAFIVTLSAFIIRAILKTQILAFQKTIILIHSLGLSSPDIAWLFTKTTLKPLSLSVTCAGFMAIGAQKMTEFSPIITTSAVYYIETICILALTFLCICAMVTNLTVRKSLRHLP